MHTCYVSSDDYAMLMNFSVNHFIYLCINLLGVPGALWYFALFTFIFFLVY